MMGRYEKLLSRILSGSADASIGFHELRRLLLRMGFDIREEQCL